ncbi:hypothetical protein ABZV65_04250 [Streptomyces bauhiniae]|uniref:hypothetical protein n=1 Tax=Streptomyces bauhiniae TaxID=2340725 RepID=UPI0033AC2690
MATRTMKGPEPLFRLKVVRNLLRRNPAYTRYGCGVPPMIPSGETTTTYFGPYVRRHAATTMRGIETGYGSVVSAEIETCQPSWEVVK